ncbi:MAG: DNA (cytosine-5-)-methyltransferase [Verrucomicrobiaceae bacterium]|nr:MAG: DNA (cytosine-5-)-methyltransferase [Verrucomicrobiaceae bacterium]
MPGPRPARRSSALSAAGGGQPRRFIDLFCGIGGFRMAFERLGAQCVFSSDWDKFSRETYTANFGETPCGDIRAVAAEEVPAHDILCGGFPCQPFSLAGVSKKKSLGRSHGFDDARQGNLFFEIARLLKHHRPAAFVLENVKNLQSHDQGRTFGVIHRTLTEELGYTVHHRIIDARAWVPQHRERIFLVGFREPRGFSFPVPPPQGPVLRSILERNPPDKYILTDKLWQYLLGYAAKHAARGNGFGCSVFDGAGVARTLSARYYKDGSEILISRGAGCNPRRLTPRECARLMGYPDSYQIPVSDTQAYRQFGNSVAVPVVAALAESVMAALDGPTCSPDENPAELSMVPAHGASPQPVAVPLGRT